jgi:hypothetical protein
MKSIDKDTKVFGIDVSFQFIPEIKYVGIGIGTKRFRCLLFSYVLLDDLGLRPKFFTYEAYGSIVKHNVVSFTNIQFGRKKLIGLEVMKPCRKKK